jgi:hypothetical protein
MTKKEFIDALVMASQLEFLQDVSGIRYAGFDPHIMAVAAKHQRELDSIETKTREQSEEFTDHFTFADSNKKTRVAH